jgi:hypothetical protein
MRISGRNRKEKAGPLPAFSSFLSVDIGKLPIYSNFRPGKVSRESRR